MILESINLGSPQEIPAKRLPGSPGLWLFVLMDSSIFAILFLSFSLDKIKAPGVFAEGALTLDLQIGTINTIVLLTSSWLVAMAAQEAKRAPDFCPGRVKAFLFGAATLGFMFISFKIIEYTHVVKAGYTLTSNNFHMYYFVTTGLHLLHVIIGLIALCVTSTVLIKQSKDQPNYVVETVATYWHMVDFLWVMIFPLFYLVA